ncbi:TspO/MBR family-domain-containing protein [Apiosordaria backusii]|uniref:TspO/MBR family-domain-containing protein n=1 Tax=Apiosordaria backusii TaxID=314023 RepID=A0AA40K6W0_9PEZI|nr:TspO/MBR family-domain-containing protein [Apiosordaria backusii]
MTTYIPQLTLPESVFSSLPASILLPITLGSAVGWSTRLPRTYLSLRQPPLRPPPQVFGPVWTILYGLMGYAAHRAYRLGTSPLNLPSTISAARQGTTLYTIQLGLNLLWMPLFFGWNRPILATVDVLALLGVNSYLAWLWGTKVDATSGWLLAPYIAWLGFASYLSAGTGYLNNWDLSGAYKTADGETKKGKGKRT